MAAWLRTAAWTTGVSAGLFAILTGGGLAFMAGHENEIAKTILAEHRGAIASLYARIFVGYLGAGLVLALVLHPLVRGWKAGAAALGLALLGLLYQLTADTHLIYGPVQSAYCAVHDAIPAFLRALYRPWLVPAAFGALALVSLHRWTRRVPVRVKVYAAAVAGAVALWGALPHASAARREGPPCFLLLASDSLRADHLSCNGYRNPRRPDLPTTPHIDALAERGTNFARCLVPTASTHESWVTLMSSREPREHGLRHMFPSRELAERVVRTGDWFPALLRDEGYRTAVIGGWCGTTFDLFDMGYERVDVSNAQNHLALIAEAALTMHLIAVPFLDNAVGRALVPELERVSFTRGAVSLTRRAEEELEEASRDGRPFFLTVFYHGTHLPYSASHPYYALYTDPDYRGPNRYRVDFRIDEMIQKGFRHDLSEAEIAHLRDLYDGTVREFDDQVGALLRALDELGLRDRTLVGVISDHGDDLYEPGCSLGHGVTLFGGDHANHIPAVFAGPGVPQRRVDEMVRSYDLAPTWASWLGLDAPGGWQGLDVSRDVPSDLPLLMETCYLLYRQPVPDLRPGERVKGFPTLDHATFFDPSFDHNLVLRPELESLVVDTKCFAVRQGRWKLISVPGEEGPILRLYDIEADPHGTRDLSREKPEDVARLAALLPR